MYGENYAYASLKDQPTSFVFHFQFGHDEVVYSYKKQRPHVIIEESFSINGELLFSIDRATSLDTVIKFKGTETLNKKIENNQMSIISYLRSNANLDLDDNNNQIFYAFTHFIEGMLFFRSLEANEFIGFTPKDNDFRITKNIIKDGLVDDFEAFLNRLGITCRLKAKDDNLYFVFDEQQVEFFSIASSGTKALAAFYFWLKNIKEHHITFLFIDEFDEFYHFEMSKEVVLLLRQSDLQFIVTTHNTSIMTNDLLRPDCYYIIQDQKIDSLPYLTDKELRFAHNLEKLYKADVFKSQ